MVVVVVVVVVNIIIIIIGPEVSIPQHYEYRGRQDKLRYKSVVFNNSCISDFLPNYRILLIQKSYCNIEYLPIITLQMITN